MKFCDSWLRERIEHGLDAAALAERLTMLGLEVESVAEVASGVTGVVVGRVVALRRHPGASKLSLCTVDVGAGEPLAIVCGAANVREGGLYPTAVEGAHLPGGREIRETRIRGEISRGMLCSATELGLESVSDGLIELDPDAHPGADVAALLRLGDLVLDVNVTPNRADCFSVNGIAREVGAAIGREVRASDPPPVPHAGTGSFPVTIAAPADCPRFAGRVITGLRTDARTPLWMQERLRRCGVRPIHPVVDVTNYVMLELGQPMHAYDLAQLRERITVRRAAPGESLVLLDGQEVSPDPDVLVIAHEAGPVGLAGIMGGAATAVSAGTRDVFLESAFFAPAAIAGRARRFGLHTDASMRFERGVDPALQVAAIQRATQLILDIAGGTQGPVSDQQSREYLPARRPIRLRRSRLQRILGASVPDAEVGRILRLLGLGASAEKEGWSVTAPSTRFDIEREEDVIEEIARVHGYDRIAAVAGRSPAHLQAIAEVPDPISVLLDTLVARGYQEAITYSFVDPALAAHFGVTLPPQLTLVNPISADLAAMRETLWPGLAKAARENLHRQQGRTRLFEIGTRFLAAGDGHREEDCLAAIVVGARVPEQWGAPSERADFFDVKSDVEAVLALAGHDVNVQYAPATHPALHPGRCARISVDGHEVGWIGELHPAVTRALDMPDAVVFEIATAVLLGKARPCYRPVSRFPSVRRDVAVVVAQSMPSSALLDAVRTAAPETLRDAFVFDIYTGPQVGNTEKSVAIGLILQDTSRTLTDADADSILQAIREALGQNCGARIRE